MKQYVVGQQSAGIHGIKWDGKNNRGIGVSPGVYFYMLKTENEAFIKKMVINRSGNSVTPLRAGNYSFNESIIGKENAATLSSEYKVVVESDTNTTPLIVIQEFPNQEVEGDTILNFEVEEARIIIGKSIDGVKLGDDSTAVISKLGTPDEIHWGDFDGFFYEYLNQDKTERRLKITFMPSENSRVTAITVYKVYGGKTKDGIGIGVHMDSVLKILGTPFSTYSGESIVDHYLLDPIAGYLNSQIYLYYDVMNINLVGLLMMTHD